MPYLPLILPDNLPAEVAALVVERIDPLLADVHAMLRLPMGGVAGLEAGCNLTTALTLFEIVGGVSQELYLDPGQRRGGDPAYLNSGTRFKKVLEDYFPWAEEPQTGDQMVKQEAAKMLYLAYRNALTHNLGIARHPSIDGKLRVAKGPLTNAEIEAIEISSERPADWSQPTLRRLSDDDGGGCKLTVKCFYWGVRRMIVDILHDIAGNTAIRQQPTVAQAQQNVTASATTISEPTILISHVSSGSTD